MYRIAIVDDEQKFIDDLNEKIEMVMAELMIADYSCSSFSSSDQLFPELDRLNAQGIFFNLVLLDISLNEKNTGMDVARIIKEKYPESSIAFVTTHNEYVYEGYEVRAIYYFVKPVQIENLKRILKKDYEETYLQQRVVFEDDNDNTIVLSISEISYIESYYGKLTVHAKEQKYVCNKQHQQLLDELSINQDIINTHKSFWINLKFVRKIQRYSAILQDETKVPISKINYLAVKTQFENYLMKKL